MSKESIEHLAELLVQKEKEIEELNKKMERLEDELNGSKWAWCITRPVKDDNESLPVPRLEIIARKLLWDDGSWTGDIQYDYRLAFRHLTGELLANPLGRTVSNSSNTEWPRLFRGKLALPFRDGAHIHHDTEHLGLPAFMRCDDLSDMLGADDDYECQKRLGREHRREP